MKKQIENIFSRGKTEKEPTCPNPKIPIIIDTREKQSLISATLLERKAKIKYEKLDIGDYLIGDTIIERKTFSDFVGSMINKRLINQLREIKKYPKHFLIIEGFYYDYNKFNVHENAIRGMLLSIAVDFQVPVIFTEDEEDTVNFLILTAKKYEKPQQEFAIRQTKTPKTEEEQKQFILEGFPGVGPAAAKNLLDKFPTLQEIFNSTEEELQNILDKNKLQKFKSLLKD
jgi:Fanconi anemia group M protein